MAYLWRWGVDNKERLALAEKIQKDIQKRTLNYRLVQRREKIEREFEKIFQAKWILKNNGSN